ncbi:MAG: carbonic anhydrase [Candidatus Acidiferrales bacterium]
MEIWIDTHKITPDEALQRLIGGNTRFISGNVSHPNQNAARRAALVKGQAPFAIILACSDSRVSPELLFDQGLGDLFVIRVVGNVVDEGVAASAEYAVEHLHTPLLLVLGHQQCGVVTAALLHGSQSENDAKNLRAILNHVIPALKDINPHHSDQQRLAAAIEANVRQSMKVLAAQPILASAVAVHSLRIVGAVHELSTGKVQFLS